MSMELRTLLIIVFGIGTLYFVVRSYASIRRIQYIGYFHHYRLYMPIAGMLVSLGAVWAWAAPQLWYLAGALILSGLVLAGREMAWQYAAIWKIISAKRALSSERSRFREHTDHDRKVLGTLGESLKSADWAWKARRFRDAHRSAKGVLSKLHRLRTQLQNDTQ